MKKFTFLLIAAFMAVAAWAGVPSEKMVKKAPLQTASLRMAPAKQMVPKQKAVQMKLQAPAANRFAAKAKAGAKKAPKKKIVVDDLLNKEWMMCSQFLTYNSETQQLEPDVPAAGGTAIKFSVVDAQTVAVEGFIPGATELIQATYTETKDEELLSYGVEYEFSIADGQTLLETDYGPIVLKNFSAEEGTPLTGYVFQNGSMVIDVIWAAVIGGDGQYAGSLWTNYNQSYIVPVNGKMAWSEDGEAKEVPVVIDQDPEDAKFAYVYNFAGEEACVTVSMKEDKTFAIDEQPLFYYDSTYGYFCVSGLEIVNGSYYIANLTGVGTEKELTFGTDWMIYSPTKGSIMSICDPATITLTEGEFAYPVIADVAATPADPEIIDVGAYDPKQEYGYIMVDIPVVDVDGKDIKESKLYYKFYSDIDDEIAPITFTPDLYKNLEEDLTEIPYTFTDNYDFAFQQNYRVVYLNYDFSNYDRIGVQSIYRGGDEERTSEIVWYEEEKPIVTTTATFNFNEMNVAVSSGTGDNYDPAGDITEDFVATTEDVTLTISPKEESNKTPNRFWGTNAGPQLRVYSGTLTFEVPEGYTMTEIAFVGPKWNTENSADCGEIDQENKIWTGEAQTVVFSIAGNSQFNRIEVTYAEEGGEPQTDVLVELPEGVEPIEYTLTATGGTSQGNVDIEDTKLVAFDGTDVYLQGLSYYFPDAYVKGTLTADGQILVPTGQFVGEDEYGTEYLVAVGTDAENKFIDAENVVFNYDAESGVISLAEGSLFGGSSTKDVSSLYIYFDVAAYTPGALVLPDVVEAPEGLETETWYLSCNSYNGKIRANELQIGVATNTESNAKEMYIQGLCEYLPEAWVKGTVDEETQTVTFASGQFYGIFSIGDSDYRLFFVGYEEETEDLADVVFTLNEEDKTMTTNQWIILNGKQNELSYYDYYSDVVISKNMPEIPVAIVAPEDLVTEAYQFKGFDTYYKEDETREVQVGFYGDNQVYIQGLSGYVPEAWVIGTLEGNTLTIPETYMGIFEGYLGNSEVFFSGTTFVYNAEAETFTSEAGFVSYETPEDEYWMDEYTNVVLAKLHDVAAVPADPEIIEFVGIGDYPKVKFNVATEDVEGNPLMQDKLTYQLFYEQDEEALPLVLTTDLYKILTEDMSEIPYGFSEGRDIYTSTVYLNQGEEELKSWTKVGIQSTYYGGGETRKSNIVWHDLKAYWDNPTGISKVNTVENQNVVYFDLQGRNVNGTQKGLLIKQVRTADGNVKTYKVVRK